MAHGLFITFEGPEGSGKSTQIKRTSRALEKMGYEVLVLREPGGTPISEAIREVLLAKEHDQMQPETELLLYLAARAQIVRERILPALEDGVVVICDRYEDSTLAYQGYGRGFSLQKIRRMSDVVRGSLIPDRTFLLDIDPRKGLSRGGRHDRMEKQTLSFHRSVREGYLKLAKAQRGRFTVINGNLSKQKISDIIMEKLKGDLGED